jgi:autotransporter-associated beta strand protein
LVIDSATLPGVEPLHWAGSGSGTWDAADSGNTIWNDSTTPTALSTYFVSGDSVQFDQQYISANQTVTLNSTVSPTSTLVSNANYSYNISGSGAIGGIGGLTKTGTGTLTLATANTYSGGTVINNGTVAMGNVTALGASGATITVNSGGVLDMNGMSMPSANTYAMNINGSGPSGAGAFIDGIATGALFYGSVALGSDSTIKENGATWQLGDGSHACPISGNHVLTVGGSSGYLVSVYGNVSVASIIKVDAGQLKMNSANSFAGGLTVKNGNVSVTSSGAFGSGTVTLLDTAGTYGAKLGLGATGNITNSLVVQAGSTGVPIIDNYGGSFTPVWAGNITLNNTNTALSLQTASATPTGYTSVSGPISGPGALSIDNPYSAGIVKLYGTNTYTGATYINLGTLALLNNASISNSSVISIVGGATLDVSGLTSGTFVLSSGQTLSNSTTATGNLNGNVDASRGNFVVNYDGSTPVFAVSGGSLTLSAGTTFSITNLSGAALGTNTLISSGVAGTAPAAVNLLRGAGHLQINSGALQLVVTTSSTPTVPVFTPGGGAYYGALTVTITSDAGTTIHYTTDGSDPTTSGTVQSAASPAAVTVAAGVVNETIRACATQPGSANSGVAAASYNTTLSSAFAVQPLVAGTNDSTLRNNYTGYTGYTFTNSSEPILVTALGYADGTLQGTNGSGLGSAHTVALWNAAGTLIASVTVPAGTAGQYLNGYWYAALASPVTLTPNTGYTLAASQVSGGDMWPNSLGSYFPGYSLPTFSGIATIADANAVWGNNYPAPPNNVDTIGTSVWLTCNLQGSIAPSIAIQPVKLANGNVQFNALGAYGASYRIWASTNLALAPVTSTWSNVSSGTFTGQSVSYTDTAATNYPARFYVITIP